MMAPISSLVVTLVLVLLATWTTQALLDKDCRDLSRSLCHMTNSQDCYDVKTRQTCCASCSRLANSFYSPPRGCRYGDRSASCEDMPPYKCYNPPDRAICCDTCLQYRKQMNLGRGCEYGNQSPGSFCRLVTYTHCKSLHTRSRCCETCAEILEQRLRAGLPSIAP